MTLDATIAAIKVAAPTESPGGIAIRPNFQPSLPAFTAEWLTARSANFEAVGDTEQEALDNLLLVLQGKSGTVEKRIRLRKAQAEETAALAEAAIKTAEREAVEAEPEALAAAKGTP